MWTTHYVRRYFSWKSDCSHYLNPYRVIFRPDCSYVSSRYTRFLPLLLCDFISVLIKFFFVLVWENYRRNDLLFISGHSCLLILLAPHTRLWFSIQMLPCLGKRKDVWLLYSEWIGAPPPDTKRFLNHEPKTRNAFRMFCVFTFFCCLNVRV